MLGNQKLMAFVATRDFDRARRFYRDTLGLRLVNEDGFALVFEVGGTMIRVAFVNEMTPAKYTVLGWEVLNILQTARELGEVGVMFERYSGMQPNEVGIWKSPSGTQVAWFKDPDGNTLSITQF